MTITQDDIKTVSYTHLPGLIQTDMSAKLDESLIKSIASRISLGRLGKPEEVAGLICFLASDEASYITGQVIEVSGGISM